MLMHLSKGQRADLTKENPGLKNILIGLGWHVDDCGTSKAFELDVTAYLCGANGKCPTDKDFIFYGNLEHESGAIKHLCDRLIGPAEGDEEQIQVDLSKVANDIEKISFALTIDQARTRKQNFGQVSNVMIRLSDEATQMELMRYELKTNFTKETAIVVGELYKHNGEWKFNAIGSGLEGGLIALCDQYGIEIELEE